MIGEKEGSVGKERKGISGFPTVASWRACKSQLIHTRKITWEQLMAALAAPNKFSPTFEGDTLAVTE